MMKKELAYSFLMVLLILIFKDSYSQNGIRHFIFFSRDRKAIRDSSFYLNPGVTGAQITYPWKRIEPRKDVYDFSEIEEDIDFLESKGKRLFIQIQDVTFDSTMFAVPEYILTDTSYHGGVNSQYATDADGKEIKAGWVARRWDPSVAERFHQLLIKIAAQFDGRIEGINLPETALDFSNEQRYIPEGFNNRNYVEAIKKNMWLLKTCFKNSVSIQYANFMPGDSDENLREIYTYARKIKEGMGGPDIKVYRKAQMDNSYPLIRSLAGITATGVAVQEGNYAVLNPKTGKQVTLPEILSFAQNYLKLTYIFWCTEEPYYFRQVLPLLRSLK